ncbi:MAG: hypothetical protein JO180_07410 [Gemmatirosa sp.]|nr:hypothetical protein [Gemmatirosa sp.]
MPIPHAAHRLTIAAVLSVLAGAACAPRATRATTALFADEKLQPDSVIVRVASRFDRPLTIFVVRDYVQTRLGDVAADGEARFALPAADVVPGGFALAVTPPASKETMRTIQLAPKRGQIVRFEIEPRLVESRALIRWPPRCETCADPMRPPR